MDGKLTRIDRAEVLRYLSYYGGGLPPDAAADIGRCEALLMDAARPRVVWRRFPLDADGAPRGTEFRPAGADVRALLTGCEAVIVFAATLGAETDALIRRAQVTSMADAVILDACASAAVENMCDNLCADLAAREAPLRLTDRFSPGYGDLPLSQQAEFCALLDVGRRIGVTLSPGGLMLPQKTVTALMGVTPADPAPRRGCAGCAMFDTCIYRKDGASCGKS